MRSPTYNKERIMTLANQQNTIKSLVSAIQHNGIQGLINTATALYRDEVRSRLHYSEFAERTDRAKNPLLSLDEGIYYSSTFTQEHFDRFSHVLANLGTSVLFAPEITVIDYGCGQGLATLTFLHYLKNNNCIANKVIHVHLVEPSATTLALARQYVLAMAKHCHIIVNITVHQATLTEFLHTPVSVGHTMVTLHFLSNILDIPAVQSSLVAFSRYLNRQVGKHTICAVSSYDAGFTTLRQGLTRFVIQNEKFCVDSYRFNSNRCVWQQKSANGHALFAQVA